MVEEKKEDSNWKKTIKISGIIAALGLGFGAATHKTEGANVNKVEMQAQSKSSISGINKTEFIFIQDIHRSFQNNSFYTDLSKYTKEDISSEFNYVFNTVLKDDLKDNEIKQLITSLHKIIKVSKDLNARYIQLKNQNPSDLDLQEKLDFYKQLPYDDYISSIKSLLKKNKNYTKFNESSLYEIENLHAFVGITHRG